MPSETEVAKRAFVKLLRELAVKYEVPLPITRDSPNKDIEKAFRKVSVKAHPDEGGLLLDFQRMSASNDVWQNLLKNAGKPWTVGVAKEEKVCRVRALAVLLTYQSFSADVVGFIPVWRRFIAFMEGKQTRWGVKHWTATAETNEDTKIHLHLMLQSVTADDARDSNLYTFDGVLPNVSATDLLGDHFGANQHRR